MVRPVPTPPLLLLIAAQLIALVLVSLLETEMPTLPEARLFVQGIIASFIGRLLRLPYGWAPVNLLLPLLLGFTVSLLLSP
jgi:hypothetical protein